MTWYETTQAHNVFMWRYILFLPLGVLLPLHDFPPEALPLGVLLPLHDFPPKALVLRYWHISTTSYVEETNFWCSHTTPHVFIHTMARFTRNLSVSHGQKNCCCWLKGKTCVCTCVCVHVCGMMGIVCIQHVVLNTLHVLPWEFSNPFYYCTSSGLS